MALVIMCHGAAAALLHGQTRLGAVECLDLALFINRQHDGVGWRVDIEHDDLVPLSGELWTIGQLELARPMRRRPCLRQMRCTELTLMPVSLAIAAAVQCVVSPGGSSSVRATTCCSTSVLSGGMREGGSCRASGRRHHPS